MHDVDVKGILSAKNGMNLYRGCSHGCIYCDSRSCCYAMDHPFEDIAVKRNALPLLEQALRRKRRPCMIGTGSMSDPYLPLEAERGLTRGALELIRDYGFGVSLLTKSDLVLRDIDLLAEINRKTKCVVQMTLTTLDEALCRKLEPHVCTTARRVQVLEELHRAGIPTVVWLCPILPFLNDTEENLEGLLALCAQAGVEGIIQFGMGLTLREGSREHFYAKLEEHFPGMKERYIAAYGSRYALESPNSRSLLALLHRRCRQLGLRDDREGLFDWMNTFEEKDAPQQLSLWG